MSFTPITDFDFDSYDPDAYQGEPLPPAGDYLLAISGTEEKRITQAQYLCVEVHLEIINGAQVGKKFSVLYQIGNPKLDAQNFPKAATVAKQQLAALYKHITGVQLTNALWGEFDSAVSFKNFNATLEIREGKYPGLKFKKVAAEAPAIVTPVAAWGQSA